MHRDPTNTLTRPELLRLGVVFAACALATLANPVGYKVYDYVRTVAADPAVQQLVSEWQPPRINEPGGFVVFYLPLFLTLLAFVFAKSKPDLTELGLFVAFGILGAMSLRNGPWFSMVAYPLCARYGSRVDFTALRPVFPVRASDRAVSSLERPSVGEMGRARLNLVMVAVGLVALTLQTPWLRPVVYKTSLLQQGTPVAAMDFIAQRRLEGNIFHPQMFGDYLIWRLWPQHKSFIDGRTHLFGLDFMNQYLSVYRAADWEKLVKGWNVRYLLLSKGSGQEESIRMARAARQSSRWRTVYEDDVSVLLEHAPDH